MSLWPGLSSPLTPSPTARQKKCGARLARDFGREDGCSWIRVAELSSEHNNASFPCGVHGYAATRSSQPCPLDDGTSKISPLPNLHYRRAHPAHHVSCAKHQPMIAPPPPPMASAIPAGLSFLSSTLAFPHSLQFLSMADYFDWLYKSNAMEFCFPAISTSVLVCTSSGY